ncbi:hypothetical protein BH11ACT8_BH11ACT8_19290 [soil metagenome]
MTLLEHRVTRRLSASRALAYLPGTALALDATIVVVATLLASAGRERLGIFESSVDLSMTARVAGPAVVATWLACIALLGGYAKAVFDVGTDEYRRVAKAGLLAAGLVGVGCYLLNFPLARGFFTL